MAVVVDQLCSAVLLARSVVGNSTLVAVLRTTEYSWRVVQQNSNSRHCWPLVLSASVLTPLHSLPAISFNFMAPWFHVVSIIPACIHTFSYGDAKIALSYQVSCDPGFRTTLPYQKVRPTYHVAKTTEIFRRYVGTERRWRCCITGPTASPWKRVQNLL